MAGETAGPCLRLAPAHTWPLPVPPAAQFDLATGHFIRRTKGSITMLPWRHPTIRMAVASHKGGGNIPVTYRGCAETYLIFRTGGVGNTNEYLTLRAPFVLSFLFLLDTFHKRSICLQMVQMLLLLCFSRHCFSRFPLLFISLLRIKVETSTQLSQK